MSSKQCYLVHSFQIFTSTKRFVSGEYGPLEFFLLGFHNILCRLKQPSLVLSEVRVVALVVEGGGFGGVGVACLPPKV